ncbi:hypothetical protein, partial [Escherichia coli]|uniref:hypothetical protein n=1 Tax=Escherichia coli TaxID=562 RepID=UPI0005E5785D
KKKKINKKKKKKKKKKFIIKKKKKYKKMAKPAPFYHPKITRFPPRSGERRGGEKGRSRGGPDPLKKK